MNRVPVDGKDGRWAYMQDFVFPVIASCLSTKEGIFVYMYTFI